MKKRQVDAVVVGSRPAGAATSIALARAGRRVIAVDRAAFPSDTLSTHLLFPGGVSELKALGALERVLASGAPKLPIFRLIRAGHDMSGWFSAVGGIDYGLCCRRPALDLALVETARAAGVEVWEKAKLERIVWRDGRAAGAVVTDSAGDQVELRAPLVVGADGRRSTVASMVGVAQPYRQDDNPRGMVFRYGVEPRPARDRPDEIVQWKSADTLAMYFPVDHGHGLTILMPPREQMARFRSDRSHSWQQAISGIPGLADRVAPLQDLQKLRMSIEHPSFFRVSSGAGWALVGDAGHFKDPVVAQGIRDALHYGRRLGELAADALDNPRWLDRRLRAYESERDLDCIQMYYLGLREARTDPVTEVEAEMFADAATDTRLAGELGDVFSRSRQMTDVLTPARKARWAVRALRRPGADRTEIRNYIARDLALDARLARDLLRIRRGGRPTSVRFNRWSRDGWTPMSAPSAARACEPSPPAVPADSAIRSVNGTSLLTGAATS